MDASAAVLRAGIRGGTGLNILAKRHATTLASFAASNVLLAFDYDGTLAPIARDPSGAVMRERTKHLLAQVAARYPCIVISGRALADLARRLDKIPVWYIFGNHGFEPTGGTDHHAARVRDWVHHLRERLPADKGLLVEAKRYSVTVHYRHVRQKRKVLELVDQVIRELPEARAIAGSEAINLLPRGGPHKGVALQEALRLFACDTAVYVGDDGTDEDAFMAAPADRLLSIRVGTRGHSRARYRLSAQRDVDALLQAFIDLRATRVAAAARQAASVRAKGSGH